MTMMTMMRTMMINGTLVGTESQNEAAMGFSIRGICLNLWPVLFLNTFIY